MKMGGWGGTYKKKDYKTEGSQRGEIAREKEERAPDVVGCRNRNTVRGGIAQSFCRERDLRRGHIVQSWEWGNLYTSKKVENITTIGGNCNVI